MNLRRVLAMVPLALALSFAPSSAGAQSKPKASPTTTLIQRGAELYDDQQYEESIQALSAALVRPGATKEEKLEVYRLLAFDYISLKRNDEADAAVRALLAVDDTYELAKSESPRFREFFAASRKKWEAEGKPGKVTTEGAAVAPQAAVQIKHASPAQGVRNVALKLSGSIDDPDGRVRGVQLAYRTGTKGKFAVVSATYSLGQFRAQIPQDAAKPPLIEYYIEALDKGGLPVAARGDAGAPLRVVIPEEGNSIASSPALWIPLSLLVAGGAAATGIYFGTQTQSARVTIRVRE